MFGAWYPAQSYPAQAPNRTALVVLFSAFRTAGLALVSGVNRVLNRTSVKQTDGGPHYRMEAD